ncbi:hypothetical protein IAT38_002834 [Cryptococcus sp. DSM 104549]
MSVNAAAGPSRAVHFAPHQSPDAFRPSSKTASTFGVVLIASGDEESVQVPRLVGELMKSSFDIQIQVIATRGTERFFKSKDIDDAVKSALRLGEDFARDTGVRIWTDDDDWSGWAKAGDPVLHAELRQWADLIVVAPCSANLLAKLAGGICDSLASSLLRTNPPSTPVILFPAMDAFMYRHKLTAKHLAAVQEESNYLVSGPQPSGRVTCGAEGPGKMTDLDDIVAVVEGYATMHHSVMLSKLSIHPVPQSSDDHDQTSHPSTRPPPSARQRPIPESRLLPDLGPPPSEVNDPVYLETMTPERNMKALVSLTNSLGGDGSLWKRAPWF